MHTHSQLPQTLAYISYFPKKIGSSLSTKTRKGNQLDLVQNLELIQNYRKLKVPNKVLNKETII